MSDLPGMLRVALHDAANNCARDGAVATLTLTSGKEVSGTLERPEPHGDTAHVKLPDGGWATVRMREIASVESRPDRRGLVTDRDHSETRLRVVGDGTLAGTHVETSHGQRIKGVTAVRWSMAVGESRGALQIEVADCEVDVDTIRRSEG